MRVCFFPSSVLFNYLLNLYNINKLEFDCMQVEFALVNNRYKSYEINSNYKIREIAGETIVVNQGTANVNMTRIISLNASARLLYETLAEREFTAEDAAKVLVDAYGIGQEQALQDAKVWVESLQKCGIIE